VRPLVRRMALDALSRLPTSSEATFLRAVYCHYVFDDQKEAFRSIVTELQAMGTFVDTDTFLRMAIGSKPVDGRYFHLSFDDGFANLHTNAAPILAELSVPAIVFVPKKMVGADYETVRHYCLDVARYPAVIPTLTWEQLAEMQALGIQVGSHTRTHVRVAGLAGADPARLRDEVVGSKDDIEEHLSTECRFFAWPFGRVDDIDAGVLQAVRDADYRGCFGAFRGTVFPGVTDPYLLPRHHFEAEWPRSHVRYFASGHKEY
jgi:peptidoglycan/xylan/chitin deacetylase (PgdA/CDA1 family)